MRIRFKFKRNKENLSERTYTIGDTQYWKRNGKFLSWTESGGRKEISEEDYMKALSGSANAPISTKSKPPKRIVDKPSNYKEAPFEDLAILAQQGDKDAEESIISRLEPLVHKLSNKYFLKGGDHDDLVQDGMIGLWDAIKEYDENENNNFFKYASMAIDSRLKNSVRSDSAGKNEPLNTYASFDTPKSSDGSSDSDRTLGDTYASKSLSPEEEYLGRDGASKLMNFMKNDLKGKERDAIFRFINGKSIQEIADDTGMSYKSVENALMRARNKIREFRTSNESKSVKFDGKLLKEERALLESIIRKLDETEFTYKGSVYKSAFGRYTKDGEPITKSDYHKARQALISSEDKPGSFDYILNMPAKIAAKKIDDLNSFVKELSYDKKYNINRNVRPHLEKIDKENIKERVSQIMKDTGFSRDEAFRVNSLISEYTSLKPPKIIGKDKELLDRYLDTVPVYKGIPLYRGMGFKSSIPEDIEIYNKFKNLEVGDSVQFIGYTSFSSNEDVALNFAESNGDYQVFIVNTRNLSGVSVDHLASTNYDEGECLYKKEARMIVKDKQIKGNSVYIQVSEESIDEDINNDNIILLDVEGSMCLPSSFK